MLPRPIWTGEPPSLAGVSAFDEASRLVLDYLDSHVPMEFWSVTRIIDGRQVYLDLTPNRSGLAVGDGPRWEDSLCHAMWEQGAPHVAPDISRVPAYATNRAARALEVRSYVGVPLLDEGGHLVGTVCGFDVDGAATLDAGLEPVMDLMGQLLSIVRNLDDRSTRLVRELEATRETAETDALTGLGNRRAWDNACSVEEARHHRLGDHASIVVLDLDGLKTVNDREGHAAGDELLRAAGAVLRQASRLTDVVARIGGDEFGVLCPQTTYDQAAALVERLRAELAGHGLSASIGVATLDRASSIAQTMALADAGMYADKRVRRG